MAVVAVGGRERGLSRDIVWCVAVVVVFVKGSVRILHKGTHIIVVRVVLVTVVVVRGLMLTVYNASYEAAKTYKTGTLLKSSLYYQCVTL